MKRFMKGCAITALVFGVLGCILAMIGGSVAGSATVAQVVDSVTGGKVRLGSNHWWGWKLNAWQGFFNDSGEEFSGSREFVDLIDEGMEALEYGEEDEAIFDHTYEIRNGYVEKYCPGNNIRKLDMEIGYCHLRTERSEDASIYLEAENAYKFQGYVEGDTLYVRSVGGSVMDLAQAADRSITLYLPDDYSFDEVDIEVGAGYLELGDFYAAEAVLEVGAGEINLSSIQTQELDVSVGTGAIDISYMVIDHLDAEIGMGRFTGLGELNGDAEVECSMGYVEMTLGGSEGDFNYTLEGAMGTIGIGNNSFGGLGAEQEINNHAHKNMDVECAMGSIQIYFMDR